jgi:hypothetical protein
MGTETGPHEGGRPVVVQEREMPEGAILPLTKSIARRETDVKGNGDLSCARSGRETPERAGAASARGCIDEAMVPGFPGCLSSAPRAGSELARAVNDNSSFLQ